jgi:hypothetical protein
MQTRFVCRPDLHKQSVPPARRPSSIVTSRYMLAATHSGSAGQPAIDAAFVPDLAEDLVQLSPASSRPAVAGPNRVKRRRWARSR